MKAESVNISHPDKILFPEEGWTKEYLAKYFQAMAGHMLPHLQERPLTFVRCPRGISRKGFYNKHVPGHFPDFVERIKVPGKEETIIMAAADEAADLVYFAGQNVVEIHAALSKRDTLKQPDQIIFDLDPSDEDFEKVRQVARCFRDVLEEAKLPSFLKTSGSRGLHIHVPLRAEADFGEVKPCAEALCRRVLEKLPELTTLEKRKKKRGRKVFLDYLRNEYGQTAIVPYSPRAKAGAPVATPLTWDELGVKKLHPQQYTIRNIRQRVAQKDNPWRDFRRCAISFKRLRNSCSG